MELFSQNPCHRIVSVVSMAVVEVMFVMSISRYSHLTVALSREKSPNKPKQGNSF